MEKKNIKRENLKKGPQFESAKNESSYHWVKKKLANESKWKDPHTKTFQIMFKLGIKWEKEQIFTQTDQLKNGNTLQYNALPTELRGTCHEWWAYFKVIHDK